MTPIARACSIVCIAALALFSLFAHAAGFDVGVSPSRFEVSAQSGGRLGQSLTIFNQDSQGTELSVRTLDWDYSEQGEITFYDELRPGSCRPWFTLERRALKIGARNKAAFRFQVDVPANAPVGECRIMLAIEGVQPAYQSMLQSGGASLSLPVNGRIAVAVYVAINGARPALAINGTRSVESEGRRWPAVSVTNTGTAHGRLEGALDGKDARGQRFELVPDGSPIMPGQTRVIVLKPRSLADNSQPQVTLPIVASGALDWEHGSFKVDAEFP